LLLGAFIYFGAVEAVKTKDNNLNVPVVELKTPEQELDEKYNHVTSELEKASKQRELDKAELEAKEAERAKTEAEKQRIEQELQAKREKQSTLARIANKVAGVQTANASARNTSAGHCETWFAQAGITGSELVHARDLLTRENRGCDPQKYNMAGSNACGVAQELPCGKSGCGLPPNADGACQVRWQKQYVQKYGGYAGAIAKHNAVGWY
jgi:hypothetical protein